MFDVQVLEEKRGDHVRLLKEHSVFPESVDETQEAQDNRLNLVLGENHMHWSNKVSG